MIDEDARLVAYGRDLAERDPGDAGLAGAGLAWGAAKAFVHRQRHAGGGGGGRGGPGPAGGGHRAGRGGGGER